VMVGSTRAARRAGPALAASATSPSTPPTTRNVIGSVVLMPKSNGKLGVRSRESGVVHRRAECSELIAATAGTWRPGRILSNHSGMTLGPGRHIRVYAMVRRIPHGKVATYGQIAQLAGLGGAARQVGYALAGLPDHSSVPWHRVINARGTVSPRKHSGPDLAQRMRLEHEGVRFDRNGRVALDIFGWKPRAAVARKRTG
jgi:methylated-DNA-protein-cysteine methyltransferase related protein